MVPFLVLLATTLALRAAGAAGVHHLDSWTVCLRGGLAMMFLATASAHWGSRRAGLIAMVPPSFSRPDLIITFTGILEILGAVGLVWHVTVRLATFGLALMLVAMFSANIYSARNKVTQGGNPATNLALRTVLQAIFLSALSVVALLTPPPTSHVLDSRSKASKLSARELRLRNLILHIGGQSYRDSDVFPNESPADVACQKLEQIGKPAVPYLLEALKSPNGWTKVHAMELLAKFKEPRAVPPMRAILESDPEVGVRASAAANLGAFGDPSVDPDLLIAASDKDNGLSRSAWVSLGDLREPKAIPILVQNLNARVLPIMYVT